jgi:ubiquinone/menaquinone biosynthesis C-methylase UbiE
MMASRDIVDEVREYWERPETISLKDENLRRLEAKAVSSRIPQGCRLLDVGCGDGVNTLLYARRAGSVLGVDYSGSMISKASDRLDAAEDLQGKVEFKRAEAEELDQLPQDFDALVTQRFLINLPDFPTQQKVLSALHRRLSTGGVYLMLECFTEGLEKLNRLRERFGLAPISPAWHNCQFETRALEEFLAGRFKVVERHDFSLYFLSTRILAPLAGLEHTDPVSKELDSAARRLCQELDEPLLKGVGAQQLWLLAKV